MLAGWYSATVFSGSTTLDNIILGVARSSSLITLDDIITFLEFVAFVSRSLSTSFSLCFGLEVGAKVEDVGGLELEEGG